MKVELLPPDEPWEEIEPLLPAPKPHRYRRPGRKPADRRKVLIGILYVLRTGIPWEMLPQGLGCGSGMTCWRYLRYSQEYGVWKRVHTVLLARLCEAEKTDLDLPRFRGDPNCLSLRRFSGGV